MRKATLTVAAIVIAGLFLAGCNKSFFPVKTEIEQFEVVQVVGIDKCTEEPENIMVSLITLEEKEAFGNGGNSQKLYTVFSESAPTVFEAVRRIKSHSDRKVLFGYIDYVIIGETAARENFQKYFDIMSRDHEIRLSPKVFIAEGCTAREFMEKTTSENKFIVDRLDNLKTDIDVLSSFDRVTILEVMNMMDNRSGAFVLPILKLADYRNEKLIGGRMPEKDILTKGLAIIKDLKMVGHIDEKQARGYNFLINNIRSSPISIETEPGKFIGLEVLKSETKISAQFDGDELKKVTFDTFFISGLTEQQTSDNVFTEKKLRELSKKQSARIADEMKKVIEISQNLKADCIRLGDRIRMKHPLKWEKLKDRWEEIYPRLKIEVKVRSDIARSYTIVKPNGAKEAG